MPLEIKTRQLIIRVGIPNDAQSVVDLLSRNRQHFSHAMPTWKDENLKAEMWFNRLISWQQDFETGSTINLLIWLADQSKLIGTIGYSNIVRGIFQACHLGFKIDKEFEGKGLMSEALLSTNEYIFESQNIHRIMANYRPMNKRSGKLLKRLGFVEEGFAKDYLFIEGAWRDHILTALVKKRDNLGLT